MMNKERGFILVTILLFMHIYILLGIMAFERVFLTEKILADQKFRRLLFNEALAQLKVISSSIVRSDQEVELSCLVPFGPEIELRARPLDWWLRFSCMQGESFYVVQALGEDSCAQPRGDSEFRVAYFRITLLLRSKLSKSMHLLLQTTVAKKSQNLGHCDHELHTVDLGPQSWREL